MLKSGVYCAVVLFFFYRLIITLHKKKTYLRDPTNHYTLNLTGKGEKKRERAHIYKSDQNAQLSLIEGY